MIYKLALHELKIKMNDPKFKKSRIMESDKYAKSFPLEAHVDGHSAFNGGAAGSRPAGGTS